MGTGTHCVSVIQILAQRTNWKHFFSTVVSKLIAHLTELPKVTFDYAGVTQNSCLSGANEIMTLLFSHRGHRSTAWSHQTAAEGAAVCFLIFFKQKAPNDAWNALNMTHYSREQLTVGPTTWPWAPCRHFLASEPNLNHHVCFFFWKAPTPARPVLRQKTLMQMNPIFSCCDFGWHCVHVRQHLLGRQKYFALTN